MSKLVDWAKKELDQLVPEGDGKGMQERINNDVLEIVKVFSAQGHSGFSASYALNLIQRLLDWKPITPLTGEEDEWKCVDGITNDGTQQNIRCSAVFRKGTDNSTAYYIHGKTFTDDGGKTWYTNRESFVPVVFPFTVPDKPERIFVNSEEEQE